MCVPVGMDSETNYIFGLLLLQAAAGFNLRSPLSPSLALTRRC